MRFSACAGDHATSTKAKIAASNRMTAHGRPSLPAAGRGRNAKRDQAVLSERVIASEMSANAAAIAAGFRKKSSPLA
jgi:hypothetical protein